MSSTLANVCLLFTNSHKATVCAPVYDSVFVILVLFNYWRLVLNMKVLLQPNTSMLMLVYIDGEHRC